MCADELGRLSLSDICSTIGTVRTATCEVGGPILSVLGCCLDVNNNVTKLTRAGPLRRLPQFPRTCRSVGRSRRLLGTFGTRGGGVMRIMRGRGRQGKGTLETIVVLGATRSFTGCRSV